MMALKRLLSLPPPHIYFRGRRARIGAAEAQGAGRRASMPLSTAARAAEDAAATKRYFHHYASDAGSWPRLTLR